MTHFTRQPPALVEAVQWFPGRSVVGVTGERPGREESAGLLPVPPHACLLTRRGRLTVFASDWVITEPTGEQHLCQAALFRQQYRPAAEEENAEPRYFIRG